MRKRTVAFNLLTVFSSWLRKSCRPSSAQYTNCLALGRLDSRRCTGSKNWNVWIGRLGSRFQIGVGPQWAQVLGLELCCLAVASQNLASEERDSCELLLSAMRYALGGPLEKNANSLRKTRKSAMKPDLSLAGLKCEPAEVVHANRAGHRLAQNLQRQIRRR